MAEEPAKGKSTASKVLEMIPGVSEGLGALGLGGGEEQKQLPTQGMRQTVQTRLLPESERERVLALLSEELSKMGFDIAGGGGPQGLDIASLLRGDIGAERRQALEDQAFAGYDIAAKRAARAAGGRASQMGVPGSSIEADIFSHLAEPLAAERGQLFSQLMQQELARREDLRSRLLEGIQTVQASPALNRLFQERLAQGTTSTKQVAGNASDVFNTGSPKKSWLEEIKAGSVKAKTKGGKDVSKAYQELMG